MVLDEVRDHSVRNMFDRIARRYDLLNRIISFHLDAYWRNQAIAAVLDRPDPMLLDLGAGTGDLTFAALKATNGRARIIGLDFSAQMLELAEAKKQSVTNGGKTSFVLGSALRAPFRPDSFDGVMTAFVLRNVSDLSIFFSDAFGVLKEGGKLVSLDMFPPSRSLFAHVYGVYFYRIVPWIGGLLSRDRRAYGYLSQSVREFHSPEAVSDFIQAAGFTRVVLKKFLDGAVCLHVAEKGRTQTR